MSEAPLYPSAAEVYAAAPAEARKSVAARVEHFSGRVYQSDLVDELGYCVSHADVLRDQSAVCGKLQIAEALCRRLLNLRDMAQSGEILLARRAFRSNAVANAIRPGAITDDKPNHDAQEESGAKASSSASEMGFGADRPESPDSDHSAGGMAGDVLPRQESKCEFCGHDMRHHGVNGCEIEQDHPYLGSLEARPCGGREAF